MDATSDNKNQVSGAGVTVQALLQCGKSELDSDAVSIFIISPKRIQLRPSASKTRFRVDERICEGLNDEEVNNVFG